MLFRDWWTDARASGLDHCDAMCLSTVDANGMPDARMVTLKDLSDGGFLFGTHLDSRKAQALRATPHAAMTFWWPHVLRQIRIVGEASRVSDAEADTVFEGRPREAKLVAWGSHQSAPLAGQRQLEAAIQMWTTEFAGKNIPRPARWGGFRLVPNRIEFLSFREDRLHSRTEFVREGTHWLTSELQP